ncbi:MAG: hypothetical protein RR543_01040 [Erysipelotrichales bacterium]
MDKTEYIARLSIALDEYEINNKYEILADYEQIIDEILIDFDNDFNEVINKIGYPEILALEIVEEFGFKAIHIKDKSDQELDKNKYHTKRQNTNVIWNIALAVHWFFQTCFIIAFASLVSFTLYFGLDSKLSINQTIENNTQKVELNICKTNNDCQTLLFETPGLVFENSHRGGMHKYNYDNDDLNIASLGNVDNLPIGLFGLVSSSVFLILIFINYLAVYKPVKGVIQRNQQHNRRRAYE